MGNLQEKAETGIDAHFLKKRIANRLISMLFVDLWPVRLDLYLSSPEYPVYGYITFKQSYLDCRILSEPLKQDYDFVVYEIVGSDSGIDIAVNGHFYQHYQYIAVDNKGMAFPFDDAQGISRLCLGECTVKFDQTKN